MSEAPSALLGIDQVRELVQRAHSTPAQARVQLLVVRTGSITHEAQNALLKVLEEPPHSTRFLFIVPPTCRLLRTVQSRVEVHHAASDTTDTTVLTEFLALPPAERLQLIESRVKRKDHTWVVQLQLALLAQLATNRAPSSLRPGLVRSIERLNTRGAMNKWLLEDIALQLRQAN